MKSDDEKARLEILAIRLELLKSIKNLLDEVRYLTKRASQDLADEKAGK